MKTSRVLIGCAALASSLAVFGDAETLTVAQGETVDRGSTYKNWYNSALTVSGTLNVFTGGNYYLCAVNDAGTYDSTKAVPTMVLAPNAGDEGIVNVYGNTTLGGQVASTIGSHLTVGGNGGGDKARINIGTDGTADGAAYMVRSLTLASTATTSEDEFKLINIGRNGHLDVFQLYNNTAKPLVVTFTNSYAASTVVSGGYLRQFYGQAVFAPSTTAGGDIILRGDPRAPIRLACWFGTSFPLFYNPTGRKPKANLVTEGDCDLIFNSSYSSGTSVTSINATNIVYRHSGDMIITTASDKVFDSQFRVDYPDVLPWGPQTGDVKVYANATATAMVLDLNGKDQKLNGLQLGSKAVLRNEGAPVTLTFGTGNASGVLAGPVMNENVTCVKAGMGTLTLSNATVRALTVTGGVLRVAAGTKNRIETLAITNAVFDIAADAQLEIGTLLRDPAVLDVLAIRAGQTNEMTIATRTFYPFSIFEKTGAGYHTMTLPDQAHGAQLHVREGVLRLGGTACTNHYWRFIVKKASIEKRTDTQNGKTLESTLFLGTLGLSTPSGLPSLGTMSGLSSHPDPSELAEGRVASKNAYVYWGPTQGRTYFELPDSANDPVLGGASANDPRHFLQSYASFTSNLYDGTDTASRLLYWHTGMMFTNQVLKVDDPSTWETIYWRLESGAKMPISSYSLQRLANTSFGRHPIPADWELQSSSDGINWTTMDERSGERPWEDIDAGSTKLNASYYFTYNNHVPYLFKSLNAGWKFLDFGTVSVAAGATLETSDLLDANIAFNALSVDCAGAGTITKFRPAAVGRLEVKTLAGTGAKGLPGTLTLPLTLGSILDAENLAGWKVYVDGEFSPASFVQIVEGRLVVSTANGTLILFR